MVDPRKTQLFGSSKGRASVGMRDLSGNQTVGSVYSLLTAYFDQLDNL
jgi:hypothetical protein